MEINKILAVRDDRMGDFILTLPAIQALREAFPLARLTVAVSPPVFSLAARLLSGCNIFGESHSLPKFHAFLREEKFDLAVFFRPRLGAALAAFLAGVPKRLGTGYRGYSFLYNLKHYEHRHTAEKHEAEYSLSLLKPLGIEKPLFFETIQTNPEEVWQAWKKFGLDFSQNWIAIHPGSGGSAPNWPKVNYAELAQKLEKGGYSILWTGSAAELAGMETTGVSLAGKTEIWELACLYSMCKVVIAPSTGPLHLASLVGTPVVGLFSSVGVVSPRRWRPLGPNAQVLTPAETGLESLKTEEVFQTVVQMAGKALQTA